MIGALVNFVMNVIGIIINGIFTPLLLLFNGLFPDVSGYFTHIINFLAPVLRYVSFILALLGFTDEMTGLLFTFYSVEILVYVAFIGFRFAINLYNKLKP